MPPTAYRWTTASRGPKTFNLAPSADPYKLPCVTISCQELSTSHRPCSTLPWIRGSFCPKKPPDVSPGDLWRRALARTVESPGLTRALSHAGHYGTVRPRLLSGGLQHNPSSRRSRITGTRQARAARSVPACCASSYAGESGVLVPPFPGVPASFATPSV